MRLAGCCRMIVLTMIFLGIVLLGRVEQSSAESADRDNIRDEMIVDEEMAWDKDLDKKLDKTIKILSAIKEEMKDIETVEKDVIAAEGVDVTEGKKTDRINTLKDAFRKAVRIWKKVRKAAGPETEQAGQVPLTDEQEEKWSRDMSDKLDKTIKAMTAMKEELDRMENK